jgi:hypothetical protein
MKKYLVKVDRTQPRPQIHAVIQPCNENQELNYSETYKGDAQAVIAYSIKMIRGLKLILSKGTFSVKIESVNLDDCIYVDEQHIYNTDFEVIADINEAHLFLA